MDFSVNYGLLQGVFAVPNCVVDKHLKLAGAAQLKVLLFLLRHSGEPLSHETMAARLGFSPADCKDAVNYWVEVGVLAEHDGQENSSAEKPIPAVSQQKPAVLIPEPPTVPVAETGNIKRLTTAYRFTQKEAFTRMQENEDLRFLVEQCKLLLSRELQGSDVAALVSIHDWVGLAPDVILMAVEYCASQNKTDMRSIERQCVAWVDRGIVTHEQADAYIKEQASRHTNELLVQSAFGITGRSLSTKERDAIATWFNEYGYDMPMIRIAYDKTIDNTGRLSFSYLSKILFNWHKKGITTAEQAMQESLEKPQAGGFTPSLDMNAIENEILYNTPKI